MMERRVNISVQKADAQAQLMLEVRALPMDERQKLLAEAGVKTSIDATQSLAIKAELAIPWYRLRIRKWLNSCPGSACNFTFADAQVMEHVYGLRGEAV